MRKRWIIYAIVGMLFGIFDFYYQEFTEGLNYISNKNIIVWFVVAWIIWLLPAIPIDLYEIKVSGSIKKTMIANVFTWILSVYSYYIWIPIKLIFTGQASMADMYISNYKSEHYFDNLRSILWGVFSEDSPEWIAVAIVGGSVIGFLVSYSYLHLRKYEYKNK